MMVVLALMIINVYLWIVVSSNISDLRSQVINLSKLNLAFQADVQEQFKNTQKGIDTSLVTNHQLLVDEIAKMTKSIADLNVQADRRLSAFEDEVKAIRAETDAMQKQVVVMQMEVESTKGVAAGASNAAKEAAGAARQAAGASAAARAKLNQKVLTGSEVQQAKQSLQNQALTVEQKKQQLRQQYLEQKQKIKEQKKAKAPPPIFRLF